MERLLRVASFIMMCVVTIDSFAAYYDYYAFIGKEDGLGYEMRLEYADRFKSELISSDCYLADASSAVGDFVIPSETIDPTGKISKGDTTVTVVAIGHSAFRDNTRISTVKIPETVSKIESGAFWGSSLVSVDLPASMVEIGGFNGCQGLRQVTMPESVRIIGPHAFEDCVALSDITIPNSIKIIGENAFRGCTAIQSISIPSSVDTIGQNAFQGCMRLYDLRLEDSGQKLDVGYGAFDDCSIIKLHYGRPGTAEFSYSNILSDLTIGDEVTELSSFTFYECPKIPEVKIPAACKRIGESAFGGCTGLHTVIFEKSEDSYVEIESGAFGGCVNLSQLVLPKYSVKTIGSCAFFDCAKLVSIKFPNSLESIGESAFSGCVGLTELDFGYGVKRIDGNAFEGCTGLSVIDFPTQISTIGNKAFFGCEGLEKIEFSNIAGKEISIGRYAFSECVKLRQVNNIDNADRNRIDAGAFKGCTSLDEISVGACHFGKEVFEGCTSLKNVQIAIGGTRDYADISGSAFDNCPIETLSLIFDNQVNQLKEFPFRNISTIKKLTIDGGYDVLLRPNEFEACRESLTTLFIKGGNISICEPFVTDSLTLASNVNYVDSHGYPSDVAFGVAKVNKYIEIKGGISIPENAFAGSQLEVVVCENGSWISKNAFKDCPNIRLLKLRSDYITIDADAFSGARIGNIVVEDGHIERISFEKSSFDEDVYDNAHLYYIAYEDCEIEDSDWNLFKHCCRIPYSVSDLIPLYVNEPDNLYHVADSLISVNGLLFEYTVTEAKIHPTYNTKIDIVDDEYVRIDSDGTIHPNKVFNGTGQSIYVSLDGYCPELEINVIASLSFQIFMPARELSMTRLGDSRVPAFFVENYSGDDVREIWHVEMNEDTNLEDVTITSSDDEVVNTIFDSNGYWLVYFLSPGHAKITAMSKRHPEIRDSVDAYVLDRDFKALEGELHLKVGETAIPDVKVPDWFPQDSIELKVGFSLDNPITIDNGIINAIGPGEAPIKACIKNWGYSVGTCMIYVEETAGIYDTSVSPVLVRNVNGTIILENVPHNEVARIYNLSGSLLYEGSSHGEDIVFSPGTSGIYIINVADRSYKVAIY